MISGRRPRFTLLVAGIALVVLALLLGACSSDFGSSSDPTPRTAPLKKDGSRSGEFEQDDYDAADEASPEVKDYCADAVSEAQRLGCESHVQSEDIP